MFSKGKRKSSNGDVAERTLSKDGNGNGGKRGSRLAPSIISTDLTVHGALTAGGDIQIDGTVDGDISSHSLTIGEKATVHGEILCEEVIVRGRVIGTVRAMKVILASTAHVEGDIFHNALSVEAGAFYEGNCRHSDDPLNETTDTVNALPVTSSADSHEDETDTAPSKPGSIAAEIFDTEDNRPGLAGDDWTFEDEVDEKANSKVAPGYLSRTQEAPSGPVARATTLSRYSDREKVAMPAVHRTSAADLDDDEDNDARTPASVKAALRRLTGVNAKVAQAKADLDRDDD